MRVGVPREGPAERRVALVPDLIPKLQRIAPELEVLVESGAGEASGFPDAAYVEKGARIVERAETLKADVVWALEPPQPGELEKGAVLICTPDPLGEPGRIADLAAAGVTCFALELVPRISRAQSMDVLSSQANVGGYKAVLMAAAALPKLFPLLMTSAGTVRPARVFILGAGVAGLQAIATARRLGAVVEAYDIRPETKEQVESLGARFIEFDLGVEGAQDAGGYAKELTDEQKQRQAELMAEQIRASDVVVTTAQVPGRKAPLLVPADVVEGMRPGSVIVDMAADSGGNCALSKPGEDVVAHGVTILGPSNLPGTVAQTSSQLLAANFSAFLAEIVDEGKVAIDLENEVVSGALACHKGEVTQERIREALA